MTFLCLAGLELVIIDEDLLKEANLVSLSFGIRIHKTNWTSCGPLKGKIEGGRLDVIYQESCFYQKVSCFVVVVLLLMIGFLVTQLFRVEVSTTKTKLPVKCQAPPG